MRFRAMVAIAFGLIGFATSSALAEGRTMIVLDGSGSMWGQIDGRPKLEIAREALGQVLSTLPEDADLGLMSYGHRRKGDCSDIEVLVPTATGTAGVIQDAANALHFRGKTPLTEAVRQAAAELNNSEAKATVLLITDGIETCEADPCALAAELESSGVDFTAHVVGFGLTADEGRKVACLADQTGGKYLPAKDAGSLINALEATVKGAEAVTPAVESAPEPPKDLGQVNFFPHMYLVEGGAELGQEGQSYDFRATPDGDLLHTVYGAFKDRVDLPDGHYFVTATVGLARQQAEVDLKAGSYAEPVFIMEAGRLTVMAYGSDGASIAEGAPIILNMPGKVVDVYDYAVMDRIVPAGTGEVVAEVGTAKTSASVTIVAGETLELELVAAAGTVEVYSAFAGGLPVTDFYSFDIYKAADTPALDENYVATLYGQGDPVTLAVGDYLMRARAGMAYADQTFSVTAGQTAPVSVELPAAPVHLQSTGAEVIEIFAANGAEKGDSIRYDYGAEALTALFEGDYIAVASRGETKAETAFHVTAGQAAEVTIPLP